MPIKRRSRPALVRLLGVETCEDRRLLSVLSLLSLDTPSVSALAHVRDMARDHVEVGSQTDSEWTLPLFQQVPHRSLLDSQELVSLDANAGDIVHASGGGAVVSSALPALSAIRQAASSHTDDEEESRTGSGALAIFVVDVQGKPTAQVTPSTWAAWRETADATGIISRLFPTVDWAGVDIASTALTGEFSILDLEQIRQQATWQTQADGSRVLAWQSGSIVVPSPPATDVLTTVTAPISSNRASETPVVMEMLDLDKIKAPRTTLDLGGTDVFRPLTVRPEPLVELTDLAAEVSPSPGFAGTAHLDRPESSLESNLLNRSRQDVVPRVDSTPADASIWSSQPSTPMSPQPHAAEDVVLPRTTSRASSTSSLSETMPSRPPFASLGDDTIAPAVFSWSSPQRIEELLHATDALPAAGYASSSAVDLAASQTELFVDARVSEQTYSLDAAGIRHLNPVILPFSGNRGLFAEQPPAARDGTAVLHPLPVAEGLGEGHFPARGLTEQPFHDPAIVTIIPATSAADRMQLHQTVKFFLEEMELDQVILGAGGVEEFDLIVPRDEGVTSAHDGVVPTEGEATTIPRIPTPDGEYVDIGQLPPPTERAVGVAVNDHTGPSSSLPASADEGGTYGTARRLEISRVSAAALQLSAEPLGVPEQPEGKSARAAQPLSASPLSFAMSALERDDPAVRTMLTSMPAPSPTSPTPGTDVAPAEVEELAEEETTTATSATPSVGELSTSQLFVLALGSGLYLRRSAKSRRAADDERPIELSLRRLFR